MDKWLKEHKGETLTIDSFTHLENMVRLITETIQICESLKSMQGV